MKSFARNRNLPMMALIASLTLAMLSLSLCGIIHEGATEREQKALELLKSGLELERQNKLAEAKRAYEHALKLDPKLDDAKWRLAHVEGKLGNWHLAGNMLEELRRSHPKDVRVLNALAEAHLRSGQYEKAVSVARRAVSLRPKGIKERLILIEALSRCGKVDEAAEHLRVASRISPNDVAIHLQLGRYYCQRSLFEKALYHLRAAKRLAPDEPQPRLLLARAYFELGKLSEAADELRGLIKLFPNDAKLLHDCARLLFDAGRLNEAIAYYRKLLHIVPHHDVARRELIDAYMRANLHKEAIHHIRLMARLNPNEAKLKEALAICLLKLGRLREAIPILQRLLSINGNDARVHAELARAYAMLGEVKRAHRHYEMAIKNAFTASSDVSKEEKLSLISEAAEFASRLSDHESIVELCERAMRLEPNDVRWRLLKARSLIELGRLRGATVSLKATLRRFKDCAEAKALLGLIQAWRFEWKGAEQLLRGALNGLPHDADVAGALLTIYMCQGRADDAFKLIERCSSSGMDEVSIALLKSEAYEMVGDNKLSKGALIATDAFKRSEPRLLLQLARLYLVDGSYEPAVRHYTGLIERAVKMRDIALELQLRSELAEALFRAGRYDEAASELKRAMTLSPSDWTLRMRHADVLLRLGAIKDAFIAAWNAERVCGAVDAPMHFAQTLLKHVKGSIDASLRVWVEVWERMPSSFVADVAIELMATRGLTSEHVSFLRKSLLDRNYRTPLQRKMALEVLARAYMAANMHSDAKDIWMLLCLLSPNEPTYRAGLAEACYGMGDISCADGNFRAALRINPFAHEIRERYARFLMKCGRLVEAQTQCQIALSLGAERKRMYLLMMDCYQLEGNEKLREFVRALSSMSVKEPDNLALAVAVAEGYERLQEYRRALPHWRRACGLTRASLKLVERLKSCLDRAGYDEEAEWAMRFILAEERKRIVADYSVYRGW
ncbi:MAG: tetratricopeptide repeat protein [Armatimonadota bacterium]|nr:tetratricopeptide repeat protein [Armatimonadota bacterium]MCX7777498.1 tetratricopeptide repeat protein [Armatimonadota bacterium]MDW8025974.1 tetratricopeptide repeat protein [Armatimonadota bacterium]